MKRKKLFSIVLMTLIAAIFASTIYFFNQFVSANASCEVVDSTNGYILKCYGEQGACIFLGPNGERIYCVGNEGFDVIPIGDQNKD